ncbi:MAG: D-2-hydroxyacid dehydrogenase [Hydrogenophaga sp.]|nr:D-2-hydroxyacid dehydrogenase [Hydrogenophaga sp.]
MQKTLNVVLHHNLPTGVPAWLVSQPGLNVTRTADDDACAAALSQGGEVLVTSTWRPDFLVPSLRWIAGCGTGIEQYPLDALAAQGVTLTNAAGVHGECVAEHAFALLLALTRRIGEAARHMERAQWQSLAGDELGGKKLAIVGIGAIGEGVARRAQGWGMSLVGIKRNPARYSGCLSDLRPPEALAEVCDWADILMLCMPALPDRSALVGARELERLGAGWLINVGRGSLVDESALVHALQHGRLRGAGLDVTAIEPLPASSPLWADPRVVLTAHNAGESPGFAPRWGAIFAHNLAVYQAGQGAWRNPIVGPGAQL